MGARMHYAELATTLLDVAKVKGLDIKRFCVVALLHFLCRTLFSFRFVSTQGLTPVHSLSSWYLESQIFLDHYITISQNGSHYTFLCRCRFRHFLTDQRIERLDSQLCTTHAGACRSHRIPQRSLRSCPCSSRLFSLLTLHDCQRRRRFWRRHDMRQSNRPLQLLVPVRVSHPRRWQVRFAAFPGNGSLLH
jgi:hypothetical protein